MAGELQASEQVLGKMSAFEREAKKRRRKIRRAFLVKIAMVSVAVLLLLAYVLYFIPNGILV